MVEDFFVTEGDIISQQRQTKSKEGGEKKDPTVGSRDWERGSVELEGAI